MYKAKADYWSCDLSDGICHQWVTDKEYEIKIDNSTGCITLQSENGTSTNVPATLFNSELMMDVFCIDIADTLQVYLTNLNTTDTTKNNNYQEV